MSAGVYQILHVPTGRRYIGSSKAVQRRLVDHKRSLSKGRHHNWKVLRAWKNGSPDEFLFEQIVVCSEEHVLLYEQICIDGYRAAEPEFGFNVRTKAESNEGITSHFCGERYGRIRIIGMASREKNGYKWLCLCDCGKITYQYLGNLVRGHTRSCGCYQAEMSHIHPRTHGKTKTPKHALWTNIKSTSLREGVPVCDEWMTFEGFDRTISGRPRGKSLVRRDKAMGFSPENCFWGSRIDVSHSKTSTRLVQIDGTSLPYTVAVQKLGISFGSVRHKMRYYGMSAQEAVSAVLAAMDKQPQDAVVKTNAG